MLEGLVHDRVDFVVVGGVAATAHGATYVTNDLDICYDPASRNVVRLAALLARWNGYPRGVEPGLPFFWDERTFRATPVMTLQTTEGAIDVLDSIMGVGSYDAVRAHSERFELFTMRIQVLELGSLISAKRAVGRPKDLAQLPELEALLAIRRKTKR